MILNSDLASEMAAAHHATKAHFNARRPFSRLILVLRAKPSDRQGNFLFSSPQKQNYAKSEFSTNSLGGEGGRSAAADFIGGCWRQL